MKMQNFVFSKYCTPAQLYLVLGVICIITGFFANYSIEMLLTKALFLVVWAWVLNWLCSKGFKAISWIIVLLPFVFFLFTYFLIKDVAVKEGALFNLNPSVPSVVKPLPQPNIQQPSGIVSVPINPAPGSGGAGICGPVCQANKATNAQHARDTCISGCKGKKNSKACEEACPA